MGYVDKIKERRRRFIEYNEIPKDVRPDILNSWIRCKNYGVGENSNKANILSKSEFDAVLREKKEFIQICLPVMLNLYEILKDTNYSIILTDENAVILKILGNERIMAANKNLDFLEGRRWREEDVGTNAIGTCIYLNKPVWTLGAEHYCKEQHKWTCSAAPIHNSSGKIIGCIDLSGSMVTFHYHTLGIVAEASNTIKEQFAINEHRRWTEVAFNTIKEGMLVLDNEFKVKYFNEKICSILGIYKNELYKIDMKILLKDIVKDIYELNHKGKIAYREISLYVKNRRIECNISVTPFSMSENYMGYVIVIQKADTMRGVVNKIAGFSSRYDFRNILTRNTRMMHIIDEARRIAQNECTVLITGESGTGKELFAHSIHNGSKRCSGPFVAINCAALPRDLVESELFGYEKGAFTGASREGNPGKFELANGGTIFLDEIGELPLGIQSKLLRVLDNHTIMRIGGKYERNLDVRIVAATNRDLIKEVNSKNFRSDLYFRLNVFNLNLIPLRERKEDIEMFVNVFLNKLSKKNQMKIEHVDESFMDILKNYNWPGNVRELENVVQRAYYLSKDGSITESLIPEYIMGSVENIKEDSIFLESHSKGRIKTVDQVERELIMKALEKCNGNVVNASKLIEMGKSTLYRKIKKYNLE
ncbi:sigma-54-dependent Fis family transcriptional regulator [Clostridium luticellarii]|jgi:transcriptional regulator of acetoin/glycerol metabolism|uniref:Acetoin dehydrogenase operon transcriptional activator AcoR n=1 Tax=Clostridium luticellarii TaxID=1691940 RepID=A0A2T0BNW8_9CLOT|nr:sigma-54-dependent Fis family transcriptional regulator [Clostridium luticellarii]MCI1945086.1 sigma-54-dependent Fis family transcriptional regulator [Clostridium luticellarii]MCI1968579.1 sigma-54-dependent Fis family transcriptional regulator [Clostridium luticellarii]MCI1995883.1 sigma-54-dependent Fis family transcriptional regulator [Clostridium luticellarii]MCI2040953.1 sigma-54-dependent Fis family transcriptional regulator [Clostridium luticellarii]PRR85579.1 Acetoin dehydrogenase 